MAHRSLPFFFGFPIPLFFWISIVKGVFEIVVFPGKKGWLRSAVKFGSCAFSKKRNALTGGITFFASSSFCEIKSTDCNAESRCNRICTFLEPVTSGEATSNNTTATGSWMGGRTQFPKNFQNPVSRTISIKKGGRENTHIFFLGRTESIPAVFEM